MLHGPRSPESQPPQRPEVLHIATEIPDHALSLHSRLEERTAALEAKASRLYSRAVVDNSGRPQRGRKAKSIANPLAGFRSFYGASEIDVRNEAEQWDGYPLWLDDVLQGVARLDWYRPKGRSIPLSVKKMVRLLDALPVITTSHVAALLLVEERQASRYVAAISLAMPFLIKGMPSALRQYLEEAGMDLWEDPVDSHRDFASYFPELA
jgi:hypothetical protein